MLALNVIDFDNFSSIEYAGNFSWICLRDFSLNSSCIQRNIIDIVNLLFLCVFYVSLFISLIRRNSESGSRRKGRISAFVSMCCVLISVAYISLGLWNLIVKTSDFKQLSWLVSIVRGLVWISLTVSLLIQKSRWVKILTSIWWASSCVLVSALNIEILYREQKHEIFYVVQWPVQFLLLFCAIKIFYYFSPQSTPNTGLSKPLSAQNIENKQTGLSHATLFSKLIFSWINSLLSLGYSKPLTLEDIPSLVSEDEAELANQKFAQAWDSHIRERGKNNTQNLVLWSIARVHLKEIIFIAICAFLRTISVVISPLILYAFVLYSSREEEDLKEGLILLGYLIVTKVVESLSHGHWFFDSRRSGMRMRSALMVAVYQKQLRLSTTARTRHSTGEIVNYVAVDAYRMGEFPWWFHTTWSSALQLFLAIGILFGVVGVGALPGLVPLFICGLINVPFAKVLQKCQSEFMISQDERLRSTSEILNSMKTIQLQSWEDKFKNLVDSLRAKEFKWLAKSQQLEIGPVCSYPWLLHSERVRTLEVSRSKYIKSILHNTLNYT